LNTPGTRYFGLNDGAAHGRMRQSIRRDAQRDQARCVRDEPVGGPVGKLTTALQPVMTKHGIRIIPEKTEQE
jgi:hypothetical protein